jgi:hypothetical protein
LRLTAWKQVDLHSRDQVLSFFLLPKYVVPVVPVSFRNCLLTLAHTFLACPSVRFAFGYRGRIWFVLDLASGIGFGFYNLILGDRFF